jgi:hypothetical protein
MIAKALEKLGISYVLSGEPTNEQEFNSMFRVVVGEDEYGSAILSDDPTKFGITWDELCIAAQNAKDEFDSKEYQRQRQPEYPSLADFADAYYWDSKGDNTKMIEYVAKCDAVKAKYPKP